MNEQELMKELFEQSDEVNEPVKAVSPEVSETGGDKAGEDIEEQLVSGGLRRDAAALLSRLRRGEQLTAGEIIAAADFARCTDTGVKLMCDDGLDSIRRAFGL